MGLEFKRELASRLNLDWEPFLRRCCALDTEQSSKGELIVLFPPARYLEFVLLPKGRLERTLVAAIVAENAKEHGVITELPGPDDKLKVRFMPSPVDLSMWNPGLKSIKIPDKVTVPRELAVDPQGFDARP